MAGRPRTVKTEKDEVVNNPKVTETKELNLEEKVVVKSIAPWTTGFSRIDGIGDIVVTPNGFTRLSRSEIINQVQIGNRLFTGIDGNGSHATYYIDDEPTRKEAGFEYDGHQNVFNKSVVVNLFKIDNMDKFKEALMDQIKTRAEKYALMNVLHEIGVNDYRKIRVAEELTGLDFE